MSDRGGERIIPVTADMLLVSHPNVNVYRDTLGAISIFPTLPNSLPYRDLATDIHMSHIPDADKSTALRIAGTRNGAGNVTDIRIPLFGTIEDKVVRPRDAAIDPVLVIRMARDGVGLLNDLVNLPPNERKIFMSIPGGNEKVYDHMAFEEPEVTAETFASIPPERLMYVAFGVAKRILLGQSAS